MSGYAYVENNEIAEVHYFLPESWKNISNFNSIDDEGLLIIGWYPIIDFMDYDSSLYIAVDAKIIFEDGIAKRVPVLEPIPVTEIIEENSNNVI